MAAKWPRQNRDRRLRPIRRHLVLGEIEQQPEGAVHRLGVFEDLGNVGVEKHNIGSGLVLFVMLSAHSAGEIVLRPYVVPISWVAPTHSFSIPSAWPLAR